MCFFFFFSGRVIRTRDQERQAKPGGHEAPVLQGEEALPGVEGDVGVRSLRVVVRRLELGPGRLETSARCAGGREERDGGARGAGDGAGEHLRRGFARVRWVWIDGASLGFLALIFCWCGDG